MASGDHGDSSAVPDRPPSLAAIAGAVEALQDGDPLAPVTVVAASGFAAVATRRALARIAGDGGGVANVSCTTVDGLVTGLATPVLAAEGLRPVPAAVDAEAVRAEASSAAGRFAAVAAHPRGLVALGRAVAELRGCDDGTMAALARCGEGISELVHLVLAVRRRLRAHGLADGGELALAARQAAAGPAGAALGGVVWVEPAALPSVEAALLGTLTARRGRVLVAERPTPGCTEVVSCTDPDEEVRAALGAVVDGLERGVPLWQHAIVHPAGTGYGRIVRQQLTAAGVATSGPELRRLDHTMAGHFLAGLLDLVGGSWPRDELVAWLSCAPMSDGPGGRPVPASHWDAVSADAGVVRGLDQWRDRLARVAAQGGSRGDEAATLARFVADLAVRATPPAGGWSAHAAWATGLLDHHLSDPAAAAWEPGERAAAAQVRAILRDLAELDTLSTGTDVAGFRRAVRAELERRPLDTSGLADGGVGDGVFVASQRDVRGMSFATTVAVGLADATVPGQPEDDPLLPDEVRALDDSGALRTRRARQAERRDELAAALSTGAACRVATWPRTDPRSGRAHAPSRWLATLRGPTTTTRDVASFAASVTSTGPPLRSVDLTLRAMAAAASSGVDPAACAAAGAAPRLAVGLEAIRGRAGTSFTRFDGAVGAGRVSPFDPASPVSATRFETYASCPRRYLLGRVLQVERRTRPEDLWAIEPIERGTLLHGVLEEYVRERIGGNPRSLERLLAIAEERFEQAEAAGLAGKPLLWRLEKAAMRRDLRTLFLEEGDLEPLAAELAFGFDAPGAGPAVAVPVRDGLEVLFRGSADRVDRTGDGRLVVSDYKTGRQGGLTKLAKDPCGGGTRLQLPLYAMAARRRFGGDGEVVARYWLVSGERLAPRYSVTLSEAVEARFRHLVGTIAEGVHSGAFPGVPGPGSWRGFEACNFCDFDPICPTTREREWGRKRGERELRPVLELRDGPVPEAVAGAITTELLPDEVDPTR